MDQALEVPLALHVDLVAVDRDDRDVFTRPLVGLKNFRPGDDVLPNLETLDGALSHDRNARFREELGVGCKVVFKQDLSVR